MNWWAPMATLLRVQGESEKEHEQDEHTSASKDRTGGKDSSFATPPFLALRR